MARRWRSYALWISREWSITPTSAISRSRPSALNDSFGSRLFENSDAETFRAVIESGGWLRRFVIAVKANFRTQYFVSVSKN